MELRHVRYFVAVAEELNFGRAARRLGISQPPLSQQIQTLEHELGARLFERSRRHVALTKAGEVFYTEAYKLVAQSERVRQLLKRVNSGQVGQLYVAAVGSAFYHILPPILLRFRAKYPEVGFSLRECETSEGASVVRDGALDFAFIRMNDVAPPLKHRPLVEERVLAALPASSRLASRAKVSLRQIAAEPFVTFARRVSPKYYDSITAAFVRAGVTPEPAYECNSIDAKLGFVACGLGVALVPQSISRRAVQGVVYRELKERIPLVSIGLVWDGRKSSAVADAFLGTVEHCFPQGG